MKAKTAATLGRIDEAQGDRICGYVLAVMRALAADVKSDRFAPVDLAISPAANLSSTTIGAGPAVARTTARPLTTTDLLRGQHGS